MSTFQATSTPTTTRELANDVSPTAITTLMRTEAKMYAAYSPITLPDG